VARIKEKAVPDLSTDLEPIAILGAGCRFAGDVGSPAEFWDLLISGRDGTGEMPQDRWKSYRERDPEFEAAVRKLTTRGGYLPEVDGFDAGFFGLSPREAELMDPQQRLLLELAWEALEHAGIPPKGLASSDTGVFVGVGSDDYGRRLLEDLPGIEAWTGIGSAMCAVANRISYALDLRGPSLAVDTACSASLVAAHLACQSLRAGESTIALVGGVNLILAPGLNLTLDAAGATSPDGRSKPFGSSADGYGRGEGAGVLVLKRLSDARRDGDRVLAVIRASAVQQDGRTNGIMAPSGTAQRALLAEACRRAGVSPDSVDYVEAHGTGTRLGDPLEAGALSAVYGRGRTEGEPVLIGSVKSNIGHLEAGAGVASLLKVTLALANAEIPPSLHYGDGNPGIDWTDSGLRVVTERTPWPSTGQPRRAGVSGFGYGGTISHLVLEEAPASVSPEVARAGQLFPLSAASEPALRASAGALAELLAQNQTSLADAGHTLAHRRSFLGCRAVAVAPGKDSLVESLWLIAAGESSPLTRTGAVPSGPAGGLVWVFSGHGSQWHGMGRELLEDPAFAAAIAELEPIFHEEIGFSPRQALLDGDFESVDRIQTLIFAVQLGLAAVWRAAGVTPDAVIGHSVGEVAAAVIAGALSTEDGARLICRRSILLRRVAGHGAMAMASLSFAEVSHRLAGRTDVVAAIAASPASTVVSGSPSAIDELVEAWGAEDIQLRRVSADVAFHSPQMDVLLTELAEAVTTLSPSKPTIPMYTTALADSRLAPVVDGGYWASNLRNPVRLVDATTAAVEDGYRAFIEISAHPVLAHSLDETLTELDVDAFVGTSLRRDKPEHTTILAAIGDAYAHGITVDWSRLQPSGGLTDLPAYPWQRAKHWHETTSLGESHGKPHDAGSRTLLGATTEIAGSSVRLWRTKLTEANRPYPGSHSIDGTEIVPAAVLISTFLAAGGSTGLRDLSLRLPVVGGELQVVLEDGNVRLASRGSDSGWLVHASATVTEAPSDLGRLAADSDLHDGDPKDVLRLLASVGVPTMGFDWTVTSLRRGEHVLVAQVVAAEATTWAPLLDAALSIAPSAYPGPATLRMVAGATEVSVTGAPPAAATIRVELSEHAAEVQIADNRGTVVARVRGLRYGSPEEGGQASAAELVHEISWQPLDFTPGERRPVVVLGPDGPLVDALVAQGASRDLADAGDVLVLGGADAVDSTWLLVRTAQELADREGVRLWAVTAGVREGRYPAQAPLWGLGRVLAGEHDDIWGGVVDLPADDPAASVSALLDIVRAAPAEDVISLQDKAYVTRLRSSERESAHAPLACRPDGTYLITGGLGVLGLQVAHFLADKGARRLVLTGRCGLPARSTWDLVTDESSRRVIGEIQALEAKGVTVRPIALDITDAASAASVLNAEALGLTPIRGVVHAAGVLDNRMARSVDEASIRAVLAPKVTGAQVLHEQFPPGSLDFFVLFSSCGQLLGMSGQSAYGAANAFLDALAVHRDDVTSFGWTSWQGQGMAVNDVVDRELAARGVGSISAEEAFAAWEFAARRGPGHYPVLKLTGRGRIDLPLLRGIAETLATPDEAPYTPVSPGELRAHLLSEVAGQIAGEMRLPVATLDAKRSLIEQGLDSVMIIVIRKRLEKRYGHKLPATLLWNQPTVTAIAEHLAGLLEPAA
jgi:6-methylsalicylic acid synthase